MKTIVISDLHIGQYWKSNNSRFSRARKIIQYLARNLDTLSTHYSNSNLVIAGDIFNAVSANTEMLVYVTNILTPILERFNHVYAIAGNHEIFIDREGKQRSLLSVGLRGANVTVYDHDITSKVIDNVNYVFFPYQATMEEMLVDGTLESHLDITRRNIIVAHMTPKEIFSFNDFTINDVIDRYGDAYTIPYILLGHYHMVKSYRHNETLVISIGNTYYSNIEDVRCYEDPSKRKRFLLINEDGTIGSGNLILPTIKAYDIVDQDDFDQKVSTIEEDCKSDSDACIYIRSANLIDYSHLMTNGYDVYYDMISNGTNGESASILAMNINEASDAINGNSIGAATLEDRWNRYIDSQSLSPLSKELCRWLFNKRKDMDLNGNTIINYLSDKKEDLHDNER